MARVVRFTSPNKDCQILKLSASRNILLQSQSNDHQALIPFKSQEIRIEPVLWGRFNNPTGDGIKLYAGLIKNQTQKVTVGVAEFKVYLVDEPTWSETLIYTGNGTPQNEGFVLDLTESMLSNTEVIGERTLKIDVKMFRGLKRYTKSVYINDLGIFDYALRTKIRVDFLELEVL